MKLEYKYKWIEFEIMDSRLRENFLSYLYEKTDIDIKAYGLIENIYIHSLEFYTRVSLVVINIENSESDLNYCYEMMIQFNPEFKEIENIIPLYDSISLIHNFNSKLNNLLLRTDNSVFNYLRFFTEILKSFDGAFHIITSVDDVPYHIDKSEWLKLEVIIRTKNALDKLPCVTYDFNSKEYEIECLTFHAESLYVTKYRIDSLGRVRMISDERIEIGDECLPSKATPVISLRFFQKKDCLEITGDRFLDFMEELNSIDKIDQSNFLISLNDDNENLKVENQNYSDLVLKVSGEVHISNASILFTINFNKFKNIVFDSFLVIEHCQFHKRFNADNLIFKMNGLKMTSCQFNGGFSLNNIIVELSQGSKIGRGVILDACNFDFDFSINDAKINGNLILDNSLFKNNLLISKSNIWGYVNAVGVRINGLLNITDSNIKDELDVRGIEVSQSLYLSNCRIDKSFSAPFVTIKHLTLKGCDIRKEFTLTFSELHSLFVENNESSYCRIRGDLTMSGTNFNFGHIELRGVDIWGSIVMISPVSIGSMHISGDINGLDGIYRNRRSVIGWGVLIANVEIKGRVTFNGVSIGNFRGMPHDEITKYSVEILNCNINGDITFGKKIDNYNNSISVVNYEDGWYKLKDLYTNKKSFDAIVFEEFIEVFKDKFSNIISIKPSVVYEYIQFYFTSLIDYSTRKYFWIGKENIRAVFTTLSNKTDFYNLYDQDTVKYGPTENTYSVKTILYNSESEKFISAIILLKLDTNDYNEHFTIIPITEIDSELVFTSSDVDKYNRFIFDEFDGEKLRKDIIEVILRSPDGEIVKKELSRKDGYECMFIDLPFFEAKLFNIKHTESNELYRTKIANELIMRGNQINDNIYLANSVTNGSVRIENNFVKGSVYSECNSSDRYENRTECGNLIMKSNKIIQDVIISNFDIGINKKDSFFGNADFKGTTIGGELSIQDRKLPVSARIMNSLDLRGANIHQLRLNLEVANLQHRFRLLTNRANIKFMNLINYSRVNIETNLGDLNVDRWNENNIGNINVFLSKDRSSFINRITYVKIEDFLKRQGYEEKAEEVYRIMWRRLRKANKVKYSRQYILSSFRIFFGYGSSVSKIGFNIFLGLFLFSFLIFLNPNNIYPSILSLSSTNTIEIPPGSTPDIWGAGSSLWMTVRYTIPIIPFDPVSQWRPNIDSLNLFGGEYHGISAQNIAELIELSCWILWSIFLIYISGIIKRREKY